MFTTVFGPRYWLLRVLILLSFSFPLFSFNFWHAHIRAQVHKHRHAHMHMSTSIWTTILTCIQDGFFPLSDASQEGYDEIVQMLLQAGARVDLQNKVED